MVACGGDGGGTPDAALADAASADVADTADAAADAAGPDAEPETPHSLRFFGHGVDDLDRVKIAIDALPPDSNPGPPADVGATDFTLEFWMRASAADNAAPAPTCGHISDWILGNVVFDRDRYNQGRSFGVSIGGGKLVFGVTNNGGFAETVCGTHAVLDDAWHHVALQRAVAAPALMEIYIDGVLDTSAPGPSGDISYPDDGVPMNLCNGPCDGSDPFLVIGAEKHDRGPGSPSYRGFIDEVRLSTVRRYTATFTPPAAPFVSDAQTAALYHLDEGQGDVVGDASGAAGGPSDGVRRFGGDAPAGPEWSTETPFQ